MILRSTRPFAVGLASVALVASASAQQPSNLGFEIASYRGQPAGWQVRSAGYEVTLDSGAALAGRFALRTHRVDTAAYPATGRIQALLAQSIAAPAAGVRLRLSGYLRTENVRAGIAHLWVNVTGVDGKALEGGAMPRQGSPGTIPWTRFEIELPIDSAARRVMFGVRHAGDGVVWFDSLALDVVGGPKLGDAPAFTLVQRPREDLTRLLSDAELALPPDSVPVPERAEYAAWVKSHARPIRSLGATDFSDLRFLAPLLAKKRVVQLGESGHGVAEFSMAKVRLIKYLHEELGYDVLAFESSLYECNRAQHDVATLSPDQLMRSCTFGVWHVDEVLPVFEYLKETQRTSRPLVLAGFDQQASAGMMARGRPWLFRTLVSLIDSAYARRVDDTDSTYLASNAMQRSPADAARLAAFYDSLATFLDANATVIQAAHQSDPAIVAVARQTARSLAVDARRRGASALVGMDLRDSAMAVNLDFLLDELYPRKKIIVWAHNYHVQHRENARATVETGQRVPRSMGALVAERRRADVYTIGLFMNRGAAALNDRSPYPIVPSRPGTLESILHRAPWRYSFVDLSQAGREPGSEWMWRPITALSWGTTAERIVPRNEYDGVLFIDTVHPPRYRYGPLTSTATPTP